MLETRWLPDQPRWSTPPRLSLMGQRGGQPAGASTLLVGRGGAAEKQREGRQGVARANSVHVGPREKLRGEGVAVELLLLGRVGEEGLHVEAQVLEGVDVALDRALGDEPLDLLREGHRLLEDGGPGDGLLERVEGDGEHGDAPVLQLGEAVLLLRRRVLREERQRVETHVAGLELQLLLDLGALEVGVAGDGEGAEEEEGDLRLLEAAVEERRRAPARLGELVERAGELREERLELLGGGPSERGEHGP